MLVATPWVVAPTTYLDARARHTVYAARRARCDNRSGVAGRTGRFEIEYTDDAEVDLDWFERHVQVLIDDDIEQQLAYEPTRETRNRKPHQRSRAVPADWELRIGEYRVYYDVFGGERVVTVVAIGWKQREQLYLRGRPVDDRPIEEGHP